MGAGPERLAVALVGCGRWGRHILRDLRALGCDVAVVARSPASVARARDGGAAVVVESVKSLPTVAGVVVAVPTSRHAAVLDEVLALGTPVFVEKPLCDNPIQANRLAMAAPERLFVMDKWRYHAGVLELARIAASNELGPPQSLHCRRVNWGVGHDDVDPIWVLLPHDLSIALEVLGTIPPAVHASTELFDRSIVGMLATLGGPPWVTVEVSAVAPAHRREVRLVCEDGVAHLDGSYSNHIRVARAGDIGGEGERRPIADALPLLEELRSFVEHLRGGPPPKSSAAEGARIVERIGELAAMAQNAGLESRGT
jgi:predicted dehydrogenase